MIIEISTVAALSAVLGFSPTIPPVVDGTLDPDYGSAIAVQNNTTGFGDSNLGVVDLANGSELDNFYAMIDAGVLYMFFGGNLESNFNKFELFIDANAGGQNQIRGDNPDVDFNGLNRLGSTGAGDGLLFDACFSADTYVTCTCGGTPTALYANVAQMLATGGGSGAYLGQGAPGTVAIDNAKYGVKVALNNINIAGVGGDGGSADGTGVTTGVEIAIPLTLLGYDASTQENIKVCAAVNGGGHDWLSNQFIGGLGGGVGNLAEPRLANLEALAGLQYAVLVVNPAEPDCPVVPPACPADLNLDGSVDGLDLTAILSCWGTAECGDVDGDGTAGGLDLTAILAAWGPCQ